MSVLLGDLAQLVGGQLHGDPNIPIDGADTMRDAQNGQVTLADSAKLAAKLAQSQASAVLVPQGVAPAGIAYITVADVHAAFAKIVASFRPPRVDGLVGVSAAAIVSPAARLGPETVVHPLAVIGVDVDIGPRCVIHAGVRIMAGCRLGEGVTLFPNVVLYENTVVGARSIIHAGAVIGAHGFGYTMVDDRHRQTAQLGYVAIGEDVEIGACTTIDRGTYGATVIGEGTKIDNQVMVGHNCKIGRHNILCAQVGIAGSTTTGDYVVMAGQVGVRDHLHIGTRAVLGAKGGIIRDVPEGAAYAGIPATPLEQQAIIQASISRLPELRKQVKELQCIVERLEKRDSLSMPSDPGISEPRLEAD